MRHSPSPGQVRIFAYIIGLYSVFGPMVARDPWTGEDHGSQKQAEAERGQS
jgi:hypothetical protein